MKKILKIHKQLENKFKLLQQNNTKELRKPIDLDTFKEIHPNSQALQQDQKNGLI